MRAKKGRSQISSPLETACLVRFSYRGVGFIRFRIEMAPNISMTMSAGETNGPIKVVQPDWIPLQAGNNEYNVPHKRHHFNTWTEGVGGGREFAEGVSPSKARAEQFSGD